MGLRGMPAVSLCFAFSESERGKGKKLSELYIKVIVVSRARQQLRAFHWPPASFILWLHYMGKMCLIFVRYLK